MLYILIAWHHPMAIIRNADGSSWCTKKIYQLLNTERKITSGRFVKNNKQVFSDKLYEVGSTSTIHTNRFVLSEIHSKSV